MRISADKTEAPAERGKKVMCWGLVMIVGTIVAGGILYCLLTPPPFLSGPSFQSPIVLH